jgi:hypothetical protein
MTSPSTMSVPDIGSSVVEGAQLDELLAEQRGGAQQGPGLEGHEDVVLDRHRDLGAVVVGELDADDGTDAHVGHLHGVADDEVADVVEDGRDLARPRTLPGSEHAPGQQRAGQQELRCGRGGAGHERPPGRCRGRSEHAAGRAGAPAPTRVRRHRGERAGRGRRRSGVVGRAGRPRPRRPASRPPTPPSAQATSTGRHGNGTRRSRRWGPAPPRPAGRSCCAG